jgi:hypothetical protein
MNTNQYLTLHTEHSLNVTLKMHICVGLPPCKKKKVKLSPLTGRGSLQGCEILRITHCTYNRLIDGSKVVILTHRLRSTP